MILPDVSAYQSEQEDGVVHHGMEVASADSGCEKVQGLGDERQTLGPVVQICP